MWIKINPQRLCTFLNFTIILPLLDSKVKVNDGGVVGFLVNKIDSSALNTGSALTALEIVSSSMSVVRAAENIKINVCIPLLHNPNYYQL